MNHNGNFLNFAAYNHNFLTTMIKDIILKSTGAMLLLFTCSAAFAQTRGFWQTRLDQWNFSKDRQNWECVQIPHSCNALDGHSANYFRGKAYYRRTLVLTATDLLKPSFLLFEGAAQAAEVSVNGRQLLRHMGGYTPFVIALKGHLKAGENTIDVMCDNHEDVNLIPVSSDFNKNNGLHNPAWFLQMNSVYFSPESHGMYRMHVTTPEVSAQTALTKVEARIVNALNHETNLKVITRLKDAKGRTVYSRTESMALKAGEEKNYTHEFKLKKPHLWNGLDDPYLYTAEISVAGTKGKIFDKASTKIGYRFYEMTRDKGFFLNGRHYPLRGVAMHQDYDGRASAVRKEYFDSDYKIVKEIGANFVRLAHYPHNDYAFRLCDSLGIVVQTEIPWVNVCGVNAQPVYFETIHQQMKEMIVNLYNHPSIACWGMWNEVDSWGNNNKLQGKFDADRAVKETAVLYDYAKSLDPYRYVGLTDCSQFDRKGYKQLKADYYSENRYNGWYYNVGRTDEFSRQLKRINEIMGICNIAEYGAGVNPFCHTADTSQVYLRKDDTKHFEEYGNLIHERHAQQMQDMPYLNFSSLWIMFDFPVANRLEGYMDSDDGVNFIARENRKYMNDKGLVTRDRKTKKDAFYLYKSLWNKKERTVYITSRRRHKYPADRDVYVKVYSNAKALTLYQNGEKKATLDNSGEKTGVIWTFGPLRMAAGKNTFKVVSNDGCSDEVAWEALEK